MLDSPSTDWSPLSGYQTQYTNSPNSALHPAFQNKPPPPPGQGISPDTPPISVHSSANSSTHPADAIPNQPQHNNNIMSSRGNPSPPGSTAGRSSNGTMSTNVMDERKYAAMEQALADHHRVLAGYLGPRLRELRADPRQARARDKLLRLSAGQFQELSTDVFDELTRREDERKRGGPDQPGNPVPKYLLPRPAFHVKRNQARQKLSTLPVDRFQQLATDVFFELERRFPRFGRAASRAESIPGRNSPSRNSPSRNGAYSRSGSRQGDYGHPQGLGLENINSGDLKPLPKVYQSNVMVPNMGTMVEDDSDNEGSASRSLQSGRNSPPQEYRDMISKLEVKIDDLVHQLQLKEQELQKAQSTSRERSQKSEWSNTRNDLEEKVRQAQTLNNNLQAELDKIRTNHNRLQDDLQVRSDAEQQLRDSLERERKNIQDRERSYQNLQTQFDDHQQAARVKEQNLLAEIEKHKAMTLTRSNSEQDSWKSRCELLEKDLAEQRKITDEVRQDTHRILIEMRDLSREGAEQIEREEKLIEQNAALEKELRLWKARYAKVKSEAGTMRPTSFAAGQAQSNIAKMTQDQAYFDNHGLIRDVHFTNFQVAVDDLLQQIHSGDAQYMSESMKHVIMAVRAVTSDIEAPLSGSYAAEQTRLRTKVSQCANHLISATKAHGISNGLSPLSLVDSATLHLTNAVVETVQVFKLRPSTQEELDRDEMTLTHDTAIPASLGGLDSSVTSPHAIHTRNGSNSSAGFSNYSRYSRYSATASPEQLTAEMKGGMGTPQILGMLRENSIEEFKNHLEDSTAVLVRAIQPMVSTIRSGSSSPADRAIITDCIRDIETTVQEIVDTTNKALRDLKDPALSRHVPPIASTLEATVYELKSAVMAGQSGAGMDRVPPIAFRIARVVKELVGRVDRIEIGQLTADMNPGNDF